MAVTPFLFRRKVRARTTALRMKSRRRSNKFESMQAALTPGDEDDE
jgi:hypothetical protein